MTNQTTKNGLRLVYEPVVDQERDNVVVTISPDIIEALKKVCVMNKEVVNENLMYDEGTTYTRYRIKSFIRDNYQSELRFLFCKELIDTGKTILKMTYRNYLEVRKYLTEQELGKLLSDCMNYGNREYFVEVEIN